MIYTPGVTSKSIDIQIVDDTGLAVTGLVAATFPAVYWSIAGNTTATLISLSDLAAITSAYSSGGVKERIGSAGVYRLDLPDAALANAGDVKIYGEASGKHLICAPITVATVSTYAGTDTSGTTTLLARVTGAVPLAADYSTARAAKLDNLDATVSSRSTYAGADTSGTTTLLARLTSTRAGLLDNLSNLDATISGIATAVWAAATRTLTAFSDSSGITTLLSRLTSGRATNLDNLDAASSAIKAKTDNLPAAPAATGDAMTLTAGERVSIGTAVWASTTRTLSSFGTLVADTATAVWAAATRTISAFGFTVNTNPNATETEIAADTDTIIGNTSGLAGSGAYLVTVHVTDLAASDLQNATVRLTEGVNTFTAKTNASGIATFSLNAATYELGITKTGYQFTPTTLVVTAAANFGEAMTQITIAAPADPDQTTGFITTRDGAGAATADVSIFFQLISSPVADSYSSAEFEARSDGTGLLTVPLLKGARYRAKRAYQFKLTEPENRWITFTAPTSLSTFPLPQILGAP